MRHGGEDHLHYPLDMLQHIVVPEPLHAPTLRGKVATARLIRLDLQGMMPAIKLNRETHAPTREIDDVMPEHQLPREPWPVRS